MKIAPWVPGPDYLLPQVLMHHSHPETRVHGESHWRRVAYIGACLAEEIPECNPAVVYLFALLHDARRLNDDRDPDHGRRAGALARKLHPHCFRLHPDQLDTLVYACDFHADGDISDDPTIGACWDADRLDLWRVYSTPDPRWLSTEAGAHPERIRWSESVRATVPWWDAIYARYRSHPEWCGGPEGPAC